MKLPAGNARTRWKRTVTLTLKLTVTQWTGKQRLSGERVSHVKILAQNPLWILTGVCLLPRGDVREFIRVNWKIHKWYSSRKERFWVLGHLLVLFLGFWFFLLPQQVFLYTVKFTLRRSGRPRSALASSQQCPVSSNLSLSTHDPGAPPWKPWP